MYTFSLIDPYSPNISVKFVANFLKFYKISLAILSSPPLIYSYALYPLVDSVKSLRHSVTHFINLKILETYPDKIKSANT